MRVPKMIAPSFVDKIEAAAPPPRRRSRSKKLTDIETAVHDAEVRSRSGDWKGARAATFVGLYAQCHRMLYGVLPLELEDPAQFRFAAKSANDMLALFDNDEDEFVEMIKWSWFRERRRVAISKERNETRGRLGWRLQFSKTMFTDYRATEFVAQNHIAVTPPLRR
jgi:hypothetical protein